MSSILGGLSRVARAKHLKVSRPVPYSRITDMIFSLMPWLRGTLLLPTLTWVHLSITPSGAPCEVEQIYTMSNRKLQTSYMFTTTCFFSAYLYKHFAHGGTGFVWSAVDRHGLPVSGELKSALLLHQLFDYLMQREHRQWKNLLSGSTGEVWRQLSLTELQALALSILDRPWTSLSKTFIFSTRQVSAVSVASPTFSYTPFTWNIQTINAHFFSLNKN